MTKVIENNDISWETKFENHLSKFDSLNLLPPQVLSFEPPESAIIWETSDHPPIRLIFGTLPCTEYEEEKIIELKLVLKNNNFICDGTCFEKTEYLLRFLQGNEWNAEKTFIDMKRHLLWRIETYPLPLKHIESGLSKGICYIHGRDKCMRPILIIRSIVLQYCDHDEALNVVIYWMEFMIRRLLVKNKIEQWNVIIDLKDCSLRNFPVTVLKDVAHCLSRNFRGRLYKMSIINAPLIFRGLWKFISPLLPQTTKKKIAFLSNDFKQQLTQFIYPSQLETYLGGIHTDVSKYDYPILPPIQT